MTTGGLKKLSENRGGESGVGERNQVSSLGSLANSWRKV